jgi:hypothetical protein
MLAEEFRDNESGGGIRLFKLNGDVPCCTAGGGRANALSADEEERLVACGDTETVAKLLAIVVGLFIFGKAVRYHSVVREIPSSKLILGEYPRSFWALEISAHVRSTSPGCSGRYCWEGGRD